MVNKHDALILLRCSMNSPKLLYTLRCVPCVGSDLLDKYDALLRNGLSSILPMFFPVVFHNLTGYDSHQLNVDCIDRLNETSLPPNLAFYSKLNDANISDEDYEHAQTVWKEFGRKTLREYHDLYNLSDVLLLADVF